MSEEKPKIHIESDWRAEAQREREKLAAKEKAQQASTGGAATGTATGAAQGGQSTRGPRELPPASFETLMAMLATQALLYTGGIADPQSGQPIVHLDLATHHIDLLGVLEDKCKGNLTDEESQSLATTIYELRSRYVQVASASRAK